MEEIRKFKNGKIRFRVDPNYSIDKHGKLKEEYYHDGMFMNDLYLNQINGYMYLVDWNTQCVYPIGSYLVQNPLKYLLDTILEHHKEGKSFYLYPVGKIEAKSLLRDLENGYQEG